MIFMIGDNPESDIGGANEYDRISSTEWTSVLVSKIGVNRTGFQPKHKPKSIVDDVLAAVKCAPREERHNQIE